MKKYFFANWKMYLNFNESVALANDFAEVFSKISEDKVIAVFPSAVALKEVEKVLTPNIATGPQNFYWVEKGGYTGEVSAQMYKECGCIYALIGHSERRHIFKETDEDVNNKLKAAILSDLIPVLCVGENKIERDSELQDIIVKKQLELALQNQTFNGKDFFVAYEPVWAIGTGENCSAVSAEHMAEKIRAWVKEFAPSLEVKVLYGGSVRPQNISEYLKERNIDGVLVGGASAKLEDWKNIVFAE